MRLRARFNQDGQSGAPWSGPWIKGHHTVSSHPKFPVPTTQATPSPTLEITPEPTLAPTPEPTLEPQTVSGSSVTGLAISITEDNDILITWDVNDPYPNLYHIEWQLAGEEYTEGLENNTDRYVSVGAQMELRHPGENAYKFRIRMYSCEDGPQCAFSPWSDDVLFSLNTPPIPDAHDVGVTIVSKGSNDTIKDKVGQQRFNTARASNNGNDNPASGVYDSIPGIEYVWWFTGEIKFSTGFRSDFRSSGCTTGNYGWRNETTSTMLQLVAFQEPPKLILPNSGLHFYYDGEKQILAEGGFNWLGQVGSDYKRQLIDFLWVKSPGDHSVIDPEKISFEFDVEYYAGNAYCHHNSAPRINMDGRWIQIQDLNALRHRYQHYTDHNGQRVTSKGYFSVDPVYASPKTTYENWRRTYVNITSVEVTSSPTNGYTYTTGETIRIRARFSRNIPAYTLTLPVKIGDNTVNLTATRTTSGKDYFFEHTVTASDRDDDGITFDTNAITGDIPLNLATFSHKELGKRNINSVNGAPRVISISFTSRPIPLSINDFQFYAAGNELETTVTFNQPVIVTGDPQFRINLNPGTIPIHERQSDYDSTKSTGNKVVFKYTVQDGDVGIAGYPEHATAWHFDSDDAIKDSWRPAGQNLDADPNHSSHEDKFHLVGHPTARVYAVEVTSTPTKGVNGDTYGAGDEIEVTVIFNQDVVVTGDPEFIVNVGDRGNQSMTYQASRSSDRNVVFTYTVVANDSDTNGIYIGAHNNSTTIKLDSDDSIKNTVTNENADRNFRRNHTFSEHKIDGSL